MKLRKGEKVDKDYKVARDRLQRIPSREILDWIDAAGSAMSRDLSDFQRSEDVDCLHDARTGAEAVLAGLDLLIGRATR